MPGALGHTKGYPGVESLLLVLLHPAYNHPYVRASAQKRTRNEHHSQVHQRGSQISHHPLEIPTATDAHHGPLGPTSRSFRPGCGAIGQSFYYPKRSSVFPALCYTHQLRQRSRLRKLQVIYCAFRVEEKGITAPSSKD